MAEKSPGSTIPRKSSFKKKMAYGVAAAGTAATLIAGGMAIGKSGKFSIGAESKSPVATPVTRVVSPTETVAPIVVALPSTPTPTETPTDQQKKDAKVAENLGKEMARLQFEYDKAHPSPVAPLAPRASSGEKPGQGNEGGAPWRDLFLVGGAAVAMYWLRDGIRTQGGRLITAIKNRFAPPAPPAA